jgi:hypothetical protein
MRWLVEEALVHWNFREREQRERCPAVIGGNPKSGIESFFSAHRWLLWETPHSGRAAVIPIRDGKEGIIINFVLIVRTEPS